MIATLVIAIALLAAEPPDSRVFAIDAPATPGLYRLAPSPATSDSWAIWQFQAAAVFDSDGRKLACERVSANALIARTAHQHVVEGRWLDDSERATRRSIAGFTFDKVWKFDPPPLDEAEGNVYLEIDWSSNLPVRESRMQIVEMHARNEGSGSLSLLNLSDGALDGSGRHSRFSIGQKHLGGELRFKGTSSDFEIHRVVIDTATTRPWARDPIDAPGWIVFDGNGRTPYRLQIALDGPACQGLSQAKVASLADDADAPPLATSTIEQLDVGRLGERPGAEIERRQIEGARAGWIRWGIFIGIAFLIACSLMMATNKSQPRGDSQ